MRFFQLLLIVVITLLYLWKQVLLVEFSLDAYRYVIALLSILASTAVLQFKHSISLEVILYFAIFHLSIILYFLRGNSAGEGSYEGYFVYFLQPFILWFVLKGSKIDPERILSFVANTVFISFAGAVLYYINIFFPLVFFDQIFKLEFTSIGPSVVIRNTSFYGNSLVAAGIGLIQMSSSAILVALGRKRYIFTLLLSFLFIGSTLSRRSIVAGSLILLLLFILSPKSTKRKILSIGVFTAFFLFVYAWEYAVIFFDRLISSIDFSESNASNTSRINAIMAGIVIIFTNLVGTGMGSLSSLGKEVENLHASETFIRVTESMYTTFVGEVGLIFSIPIFVLFYSSIKKRPRVVRFLLVYPFVVESIMGLGLINPAVNFMFFSLYFSCRKSLRNYERQYT